MRQPHERVACLSHQLERGGCAGLLSREQVRQRSERDRPCDLCRRRASSHPADSLRRGYALHREARLSDPSRPGHDHARRVASAAKTLLEERQLFSSSDNRPS